MAASEHFVSSIPEDVREAIRRAYVPRVFGLKRVASQFGVSKTTARRIVDPDYNERNRRASREAKRRRTGVCRECGGVTRYNGHGRAVSDLCATCANALHERCSRGHLLTPEIRLDTHKHGRVCRICRNATQREYMDRKRREAGIPKRDPRQYDTRRLALVDGEGKP